MCFELRRPGFRWGADKPAGHGIIQWHHDGAAMRLLNPPGRVPPALPVLVTRPRNGTGSHTAGLSLRTLKLGLAPNAASEASRTVGGLCTRSCTVTVDHTGTHPGLGAKSQHPRRVLVPFKLISVPTGTGSPGPG